eukprot:5755280-Lingulodinium_polyedra.AAC.1
MAVGRITLFRRGNATRPRANRGRNTPATNSFPFAAISALQPRLRPPPSSKLSEPKRNATKQHKN